MIVIRKAIPADADIIIDFQQKMAWETEQKILESELIKKGVEAVFKVPSRGEYYVANANGSVISSLLITYEWSDWRNANVWWIQSVYVIPGYRRQGIFRLMYLFIKSEADRQHVAGLRLYVESNNCIAQKTYESLGMKDEHYRMYEWMKE
jgi:ribosomal protein S18 acetylase RimI-like enzyme